MTMKYEVAGHVFRLDIPDSESLIKALGQYAPFEYAGEVEPLFSLSFSQSLPDGNYEYVYGQGETEGENIVKLFKGKQGWMMELSDGVCPVIRVWMSPDFRQSLINLPNRLVSTAVYGINNALMILYAFNTASSGTLEMHASVVSNGGKAYLFLAKSGVGKSTHSQLWIKHIAGSELVNDDNPVVRLHKDGSVMVYGSPWSGKTPCYRKVCYPAGAFVHIRRNTVNRVERLKPLDSYVTVYSSCSGIKEGEPMSDCLHSTIEKLAMSVPCFALDCRPDEEAARVCRSGVIEDRI